MVFYRKYRPQTIEELDSKEVREKLYSVLSSKSIPHAFLFTGPKGLGKTSTARIIAKIVNCERLNAKGKKIKKNPEPCNKCNQCISVSNGNNIDILEIDGASNRGIDEIRDLREKVKLSSFKANKKVYIIDEVHMLTTEAFNALLKTLEEPPNHVIFILCTTEPHKVPSTIASRCFHIAFRKADRDELMRSFKRIVKKEGIKIDDGALMLISNLSDGSFRDGVKILEEMALVFKNKKITKELIENKFQISNIKYQISEMVEFLAKKDIKASLNLVGKLVEQGVDMKYFMEQLMNTLHTVLLQELGVEESKELKIQNGEFTVNEIKNLVELLNKACGELKYAVLPQLPLELAIIEWGLQSLASSSAQFSVKTQAKKGADEDVKLWETLINKVKFYNHSAAGVLRGCRLKSYDEKELVIETSFKFHQEKLNEKHTLGVIEKALLEITGKKIKASVILKDKGVKS